jgi:hypothetical protein
MTLSFSPFLSDEENPKRFPAAAPITDTLVINELSPQEVDPAARPQKASKKPTKKGVSVCHSGRLKKASDAGATLALLGKPLSMGPLSTTHYVSVLHR